MNFLLWRSEFGGRNELPSTIPAEKVWEKVLTAPDNSSLNIYYHGKKIGYCTFAASLGQEHATGKVNSEDVDPEGMVEKISSYSLNMEGNAYLSTLTNNLRFNVEIRLSTNQTWQDFIVRASVRPSSWEFQASAAEEKLRIAVDDDSGHWEKKFSFSDLQRPEFVVSEFGNPMALAMLAGLSAQTSSTNRLASLSLGLKWEAHNDMMRFGHSKVRVYRLETKVLDRYKIYIFVSRVGEILWVHFPDELVLSNDAFSHF